MRFRPLEFARLSLHFEVLVAFRAAETENFGIIADEGYSFGGVHGPRAQVARFDPGDGLVHPLI
jgi:hypothetical protein